MIMTARGKAFEYALAQQLEQATGAPLIEDAYSDTAHGFYESHSVQEMDAAAAEAVLFLQAYDRRFDNALSINIQPDRRGQAGDVRDIVVRIFGGEIGLSAKSHHYAVKHSRLSPTIDFGMRWAERLVSQRYWDQVRPIFARMARMRERGVLFSELPNKESDLYLPILTAFEDEFRRLCRDFGPHFIQSVFHYLIGRHDFYKVVLQRRYVGLQSYNINGSLEWGSRWRIPDDIDQIRRKDGSRNTLIVSFAGGWQISFRIHNAAALVEPSLKFDVQLIAMPVSVPNLQIPYEIPTSE